MDKPKRPKPGDKIETLIRYLISVFNLSELTFARYPRDGNPILVGVDPNISLLPGFTIADLEKRWLKPHEEKYRPDVSGSTTALTGLVANKSGNVRHLTMVDLVVPSKYLLMEEQVEYARTVIAENALLHHAELNVLVFSGQGLHYYGFPLISMSDGEWRSWMMGLRRHPLVGLRHPTYRLRDGYSSLRVGTHPQLHPFAPIVADVWKE